MRIEAEVLELPAPVGVGVAEAFDVDAAREPPFDRSPDQLRSEEGEGERQIDLSDRALLALCQLFRAGD